MTAPVLSNYFGNLIWTHYFGGGRRLWLALHTADPTPTGDPSSELFGAGYLRQGIVFGAPSNKLIVSTNNQIFDGLPSGIILWLGVWDQRVDGNFLCPVQVDPQISVGPSAQFLTAAGDVALQL